MKNDETTIKRPNEKKMNKISKEIMIEYEKIKDKIFKKHNLSDIETSYMQGLLIGHYIFVSICSLVTTMELRIELLDLIVDESRKAINEITKKEMN